MKILTTLAFCLSITGILPFFGAVAMAQSVTNTRSSTSYPTLAAAISSAQPGDTVKLDGDLSEADVLVNQSVTLDGGGFTLIGGLVISQPNLMVTVRDMTLTQLNPANGILLAASGIHLTVESCKISDFEKHSGIGVLGSGNKLQLKKAFIQACDTGIHSVDGGNQITLIETTIDNVTQCLRSTKTGDNWKIQNSDLIALGVAAILLEDAGSGYQADEKTVIQPELPPSGGPPAPAEIPTPTVKIEKPWPEPNVPAGKHLWDLEPSLVELARKTIVSQPVPPTDPQPVGKWLRGHAVNLSNRQLKATLWGTPNQLTLSLGKNDVWDRRFAFGEVVTLDRIRRGAFSPSNQGKVTMGLMEEDGTAAAHPAEWLAYDFPTSKPVGQVTLDCPQFSGAAQPEAAIKMDDGSAQIVLKKDAATLDLTFLTSMTSNVITLHGRGTGLKDPISLRLYRHQDTCRPGKTGQYISVVPGYDYAADAAKDPNLAKIIDMPESGTDGTFFWIRQKFPAEKTFPDGFEYYLVALLDGAEATVKLVNGEAGLGIVPVAPPPEADEFPSLGFQPNYEPLREALGSSATAKTKGIPTKFTAYITVVTSNDAADPLAVAKANLLESRKLALEGLRKQNTDWYEKFYALRENGRVFSGSDASAEQWLKAAFRSWTSIHSVEGNPDPARLESDAPYAWMEVDTPNWHNVICYNDIYDTPWQTVLNRADRCTEWQGLLKHWLPAARANAREVFNLPGWFIGHGYLPPIKADRYAHSHSILEFAMEIPAQVLKPVWDTWDYSGDEAFLKNTVYPLTRELATFYAAYVTREDDGLYHVIPTVSSEHHGLGYQYSVNKNSASALSFIKWTLRSAADAAEILGVDEPERSQWREISDNMAPYPKWDTPEGPVITDIAGIDPIAHHGFNHFAGWLPVILADQVTLDSDAETKEVYLRSARTIGHKTWHAADVPYLLGASSDVAQPEPNWFQKIGPGMKLDSAKNLQTITLKEPERLLNSRIGRIHLFPAVPATATIAFRNFQTRGGFLVTAEKVKGKTTFVEITTRRSIDCEVMNPWPGQEVEIRDKSSNQIYPSRKDNTNGECLIFAAEAGSSYQILQAAK